MHISLSDQYLIKSEVTVTDNNKINIQSIQEFKMVDLEAHTIQSYDRFSVDGFFKMIGELSDDDVWKEMIETLDDGYLNAYKRGTVKLHLKERLLTHEKLRQIFNIKLVDVDKLEGNEAQAKALLRHLLEIPGFVSYIRKASLALVEKRIISHESSEDESEEELEAPITSEPQEVIIPKVSIKIKSARPEKIASATVNDMLDISGVNEKDPTFENEKAAIKSLKELLDSIDSQDPYDIEITGISPISKSDYLILPASLKDRLTNNNVDQIGLSKLVNEIEWAQIVWLNALSLGKTNNMSDVRKPQLITAILRAYLVELGYCNLDKDGKPRHVNCSEVIFQDGPTKVNYKILGDSIDNFGIKIAHIKALACYAPSMMSSHFLKTGHNFLANVSNKYYDKLFNSCMIQGLSNILSFDILFHTAMHWMGAANARKGWENIIRQEKPIKALELRFNSSPAGSALITTSYAVIQHIARFERFAYAATYFNDKINKIKIIVDDIARDATAYSQNYQLFGHAGSKTDSKEYLDAIEAAKTISVICQAYLETISKGTRIASAKVLKNHADDSIMVKKAMIVFFKQASEDVGNVKTMKDAIDTYFGKKEPTSRVKRSTTEKKTQDKSKG